MTDEQDSVHEYVPRQGCHSRKQAMWRVSQIIRRIMIGIWRKKQGSEHETKTPAKHIAYNPVARFYSTTLEEKITRT